MFEASLARRPKSALVRFADSPLPTAWGEFRLIVYRSREGNTEHLAMVCGDVQGAERVLVRVHSECFTGEVLHSLKCDCKEQLDHSMELVGREGGVVVYLRQEGRGIGLGNKVRAYRLQVQGADTIEANELLGFDADLRSYAEAVEILRDLGVRSVRLITNNPEKIAGLEAGGIPVAERVPSPGTVQSHNRDYLETKRTRMGHLLPPSGEPDGD